MSLLSNRFYRIGYLLFIAFMLVACGGAEDRQARHFEKAQQYFADKNYLKARIEVRNALQILPYDIQARLLYAKVEETLAFSSKENISAGQRRKHIENAIIQYRKILTIDKNNATAKSRLAYYFIQYYAREKRPERQQKMLANAKSYSQQVLEINPESVEALAVLARVYLFEKDLQKASDQITQALKLQPDDYFVIETQVIVLDAQNKQAESVEFLSRALHKQADSVELASLLVKLYRKQGQSQQAINLLDSLIKRYPNNNYFIRQLISIYIGLGEKEKVYGLFEKAIKSNSDDQSFRTQYISFLEKHDSKLRAINKVDQYIGEFPLVYDFKFQKAQLYLRAKKYDNAAATYLNIIDKHSDTPAAQQAKLALAKIYLLKGDVDKADDLVKQLLADNAKDNNALELKAHIAVRHGDYHTAIANYEVVLNSNPKSVKLLKLLATAYLLNGNDLLAKETLRKAVEYSDIDIQAVLMLAQLFIKEKDFNAAKQQYQAVLKKDSKNFVALAALLELQAAASDYAEALSSAEKIKKYYPKNPTGNYYLGLIYQAQADYTQAIKYFSLAHKTDPKFHRALTALAAAYIKAGQEKKAISYLSTFVKNNPDNLVAITLLGKLYIRSKETNKAENLLKRSIVRKPRLASAYINLASFYLAVEKVDAAITVLNSGIAKTGKRSESLKFMLAAVYQSIKRKADAIQIYEAMLAKNPKNIAVANNLALLLVDDPADKSNLSRALTLIQPLEATRNPYLMDTVGWVRLQAGQIDKAIPVLQLAASKLPKVGEVQYHLGVAYYRSKDVASAKQYLEQAINLKQEFNGLEEAKTILANLSKR